MRIFEDQFIVVTGGAGFIGSCVLRHLNDRGLRNIVIVDDLKQTEKWKNLVGKQFVDIVSRHKIFEWLQGRERQVEAFIHLGACSDTVQVDASYLLENNYRFSVKLAEYALTNEQRFIYASSAATYGDGSQGFSDDHAKLGVLHPLNMYGYSKHLFDLWLQNQGVLNKVVGVKYFNVFGPNEYHKGRMASAILKMVPSLLKDGVIRLFKSSDPEKYADGEQKRDFLHVKDAVRMTCDFLENDAMGIFNVGRGEAVSWNRLAQAVIDAVGQGGKIEYIDMPADLVNKYQNYTCADAQKAKKVLKEKSKCVSIEKAVEDYVRNYLLPEKHW